MSFIVYNKRTGKYLQKHSGSYRAFRRMWAYKDKNAQILKDKFGPAPKWTTITPDDYYDAYWHKVNIFLTDSICQAEPNNARQYATEGSAAASVGEYTTSIAPENRKSKKEVYVLPDYFELHEVAQTFVVVKKPDNTTTTK